MDVGGSRRKNKNIELIVCESNIQDYLSKRFIDCTDEGYIKEQAVLGAEGLLFQQEYEYDRSSNLLQKTDSVLGKDKFKYDPIGRILTHINPERQVKQFLYDPAGDLLKTKVKMEGEGEDWSREAEYEGAAYRFDRVGNLIERKDKNGETEFVWDANGRLVESTCGDKKTTYAYDPLGRRIAKETNGAVTNFYWDGDALLGDVIDECQREWVYYPGSFEPLALLQGEELYLYHNDPNGMPTRLLDSLGKVVWVARYDAWGKVDKLVVDEVDQPLRLQGQYFDGETGLHYNRFRYYVVEIGSFISQDPFGLMAGENVYGFGPNAQKWIDPLGLCKKSATKTKNGKLKTLGDGKWESSQGLIYGQGSIHGSRVKHVLAHATPDPSKPMHSVFNVPNNKVLSVVDEGWAQRSSITPILQANGNTVRNIPMGKVIGTNGETTLRIVTRGSTSEVVSVFPVH